MKALSTTKRALALAITVSAIVATGFFYNESRTITVHDALPLIVGKWLYNPGACDGKLPRVGFYDISIYATSPAEIVVNKIILSEGRITKLNKQQSLVEQEKINDLFAYCDKLEKPKESPTIFHYEHPLKTFTISYYPKSDFLIQTTADGVFLFQRLASVSLKDLTIVDSI